MNDILDGGPLPDMHGSIIVSKDLDLASLAQRLRLFAAVGVTSPVTLTVHADQLLPIARSLEWRNQVAALGDQLKLTEQQLIAAKSQVRNSVVTFAVAVLGAGVLVGSGMVTILAVVSFLTWVLS